MTTPTSDLGSSGCAVAPADSDNREKRDKSSIVTRAASKALDKNYKMDVICFSHDLILNKFHFSTSAMF